ncbi:hypothetical protein TMatcc_008412 [Talaromyces marneffei ATCC 18224]
MKGGLSLEKSLRRTNGRRFSQLTVSVLYSGGRVYLGIEQRSCPFYLDGGIAIDFRTKFSGKGFNEVSCSKCLYGPWLGPKQRTRVRSPPTVAPFDRDHTTTRTYHTSKFWDRRNELGYSGYTKASLLQLNCQSASYISLLH